MNAIKNITIGQTDRLNKPVGYTMLANLVNIIPFCLSVEAINVVFRAFDGTGAPLDVHRLWALIGILIGYMGVMYWAERAAYRANFRGAYEMSAMGRVGLAEHLRKLSLGFLSRRDPGDLSSMLITDFAMAETGISHHLPQLMGALVMPVLAFLSLLWMDWRMALAMFMALPFAMGVLWLSTCVQQALSSSQITAKINAGNRLEEYLQGIRVMKAYNLLGDKFTRLQKAFNDLRHACIRQEALLGPFILLSVALVRSGLTLMILCGSYLLLGGDLSLLTFVLFLVVGSRVFDPLTSALTNFAEFRYFSIAGGRILRLMQEPEMGGQVEAPESGDIRFEHVNFGYQRKRVLSDINLTLRKGTLTALVGPSGSGKSTLMKLCARFYDPQKGHVLFNGIDMRSIDPEALMKHISMVFQDVYLFQDTIRNNIRFGKSEATDEEVIEAAREACCHDFISRLPKGYDTLVGEGGCTLSGGEKQRISIARAILKNAPIVLLDEATASLDPENEVDVQKAINRLIDGRTVVVIAHRLKTIRYADTIVVLNEGEVVELGTHDDLLTRQGLYHQLWSIQEKTSGWTI
ncbi:MAG: ABC transporter ATP-binding protein [Bacteroidia bacterium]|nr:ABC transporter ATP-binding protein [Bacteroidia bacterium]